MKSLKWLPNFSPMIKKHIISLLAPSCIVIISSFFIVDSAFAYTPPIGIPDPGNWGSIHPIDSSAPSEPSSWTADKVGYYYVNNTANNCSDTGRGNRSVPRATLPTSIPEAGTSTVLIVVEGGPYTSTWTINNANGSDEHPIWVTGKSSSSLAELAPSSNDKIIVISDSSYIYFQYLYLNGKNCTSSVGMQILETSDHIVLRNSDIKNFGEGGTAAAIHIGMSSSNNYGDEPNNYHVIYNCDFQHIGVDSGDWGVDVDERSAIKCEYGVDHIWILNSNFEEIGEDGIHIINYHDDYERGPHDGQPQYIYVGYNTFYRMGEQAIDIKSSEHVIFSQNTVHGLRALYGESWYSGDGGSNGKPFTTNDEDYDYSGGDHSADYTWILYNEIYDCTCGIYFQSGRRNYAIGNLIYDLYGDDGTSYGVWVDKVNVTNPACTAYIVNNTIVGAEFPCYINGVYDIHLNDNIFYECADESYWHLRIQNVKNTLEINNILFYDAEEVDLYGPGYCSGNNICFADGANTDPLFTNVNADSYSLKSSSPAKNSGSTSDVYDIFYNLYSIDIKKDFRGASRPEESADWDIGAFEGGALAPPQNVNAYSSSN